ncbi:hypothetical protein VQ02_23000 [Methylobacterium variabile]|jgi:hypothetical protein|uniref:Uncharacterized protein n=1 Tax=Methylobacterium variabile TaxID=298794 RepID=A0A0J6SH53_9HYPH|nr:hypothetical protein [Methylobacterium variabile]KMO32688.1 hypothetical protein VQ02_23000 [Methylobacterium variabile]
MRSLLLAGAVLAALSTSAGAWTQSLLHPEGQGATIESAMPAPPRYTGYDDRAVRAAPRPAAPATRGTAVRSQASDAPTWRSCPWC